MMTRKDYISTAEILFAVKYAMPEDTHSLLVQEFSEMFAIDNPRFDSARFANACK